MKNADHQIKQHDNADQFVQNSIWQLGIERPDCQSIIMDLIQYLKSRTKNTLNENYDIEMKRRSISTDQKMRELFGQRIMSLRMARSWSQIKLGEVSGVHPAHINRIENAKRGPSIKTLQGLSKAFEISEKELMQI